MQILVNSENLIVGYADIGGIEGGIDIDKSILPNDFIPQFKPQKFQYEDGKIEYNKNFVDNTEADILKNDNTTLVEKIVKLESELQELKNKITPPE